MLLEITTVLLSLNYDLQTPLAFQVLQLHPKIKYFHIGCDEVYQLGQCSKCKDRMRKGSSVYNNSNNRRRKNVTMTDMQRMQQQQEQQQRQQLPTEPATPRAIFLEHVKRVAGHVKDNYNVQPIIWDDMLRCDYHVY